jgi:predicted amidophosphoribosyltransferase
MARSEKAIHARIDLSIVTDRSNKAGKSVAHRIIIVDDVDQSGSTVSQCRRALHKIQARPETAQTPEGLDLGIG